MAKKMTDLDAMRGKHRPRTCEWKGGTSKELETCDQRVMEGKSYCTHHYNVVYTAVSVEEPIEEEFDTILEEIQTNTQE